MGKTAGRSYKAAPRQLLQVDPNASGGPGGSPTLSHASAHISKADASHPTTSSEGEGAARAAAMMGKEALGIAADVSYIFVPFLTLLTCMFTPGQRDRRERPSYTSRSSDHPGTSL